MRNFQKKQLLDIITSLHLLHRESREMLERKEYLKVRTALADCQDAAIQMGEAIEQMVGLGTEAVRYLEQYCEKIYDINEKLEEISAPKAYKAMENFLIKAENEVRHMPVRREVVFLPYKASMWDSLESVYLAAKEDDTMDVYVVPIPYYDRRKDGSLGEMHYEGNEYPRKIEITDYRDYNLEEKHPDAIYIHNPYDEWNNVTCVPEKYFSRNLRRNTECLVYIPYFILGEIEPGNQDKIKEMKHFCFVPGVVYAHKVIVQSEKMRQIYINEYMKEAKNQGIVVDKKELERKILGLGSPKLDKIQNTSKKDLEVPKAWLRVIEKPDGSWKKIIFYNTSINALLRYNNDMLEKMKSVFQTFYEYRNEVALLWRPHPLIPNTIKSMRPQLWTEYEELVKTYKEENWGIYDDSADMERVVVLSDAYYGDSSSVVRVYQETGKPIMIQDVHTIESLKSETVLDELNDCMVTGEKICWYNSNSIILQDKKCKEREIFIWVYTEETIAACEFDRKIYFAPMAGRKIRILDLYSLQMDCMELPYDEYIGIANKFYQVKQYQDSIYCFPGKYPYVLEYNINEKNINRYAISFGRLKKHTGDFLFCESSYVYDNEVFLASTSNGIVCGFNMESRQIKYYSIMENHGFTTICGFEDKLYLADTEGNIWKTSIYKDENICIKIYGNEKMRFRKSIFWNNKVMMFAEETEECIVIGTSNDEWDIITLSETNGQEYNGNKYGEPKLSGDKLYILNKMKKSIIVFNEYMTVEEYQIEEFHEKLNINYDGGKQTIFENEDRKITSLSVYLMMKYQKPDEKDNFKSKGSIGNTIKEVIEGKLKYD